MDELIYQYNEVRDAILKKQMQLDKLRERIAKRLEGGMKHRAACMVQVRETRVRAHSRSAFSYVRVS